MTSAVDITVSDFGAFRIPSRTHGNNRDHDSPVREALTAANGTPIRAFCHQQKEIKIGGKVYMFVFLIAQVNRRILGLDFLQIFRMTIDLRHRQLLHAGRLTRFSSESGDISGVNVVLSSPFARILREFPEITNASLASRSSRHGVECYIDTTGPPPSGHRPGD